MIEAHTEMLLCSLSPVTSQSYVATAYPSNTTNKDLCFHCSIYGPINPFNPISTQKIYIFCQEKSLFSSMILQYLLRLLIPLKNISRLSTEA